MGEPENALTMFQEALTYDRHHTLSRLNIGNYYFKLNRFAVAMQYYLEALQGLDGMDSPHQGSSVDRSNLIFVLNNLGQCFRETGQLNLALTTFNRANELSSSGGEMLGWMIGNVFTIKGLLCNWEDSEVAEYNLEKTLLSMLQSNIEPISSQRKSSEYYIDPYTVSLLTYASPRIDILTSSAACLFVPAFQLYTAPIRGSLRVGYVSYDWRDHPMGRLTSYLVTHHNTSKVNATCISYGPDDNSDIRKFVQNKSINFIDVFRMGNDFEVATLLNSMHFDILVDITAHTYNGRIEILALKPAPIVINYLGYPGTTGCSGFDYSMVDKVVAPPEFHGRSFTESLIYLPYIYQANDMPVDVSVCVSRLTCRNERVSLPTTASTNSKLYDSSVQWICSFNANKKMEKVSFFTWMNVMRRLPRAILLLQDTNKEAKENIFREAEFSGVHRGRIYFLPTLRWKDHLFRAAACDLVLDTFVYGAHTTSSDMLWMWVPVLSLASWGSGRMPSRVAAAITQSLSASSVADGPFDEPEPVDITVEYSVKGYEDTAIRLLRDVNLLRKVHSLVGARTLHSATFDSRRMERSVEQAYQLVSEYRHYIHSKAQHIQHGTMLGESKLRSSIVITTTTLDGSISSWRQAQCRQTTTDLNSEDSMNPSGRRCLCSQPTTTTTTSKSASMASSVQCNDQDVVGSLTLLATSKSLENSREKYCSLIHSPDLVLVGSLRRSEPFKIAVLVEAVVAWQQELVAGQSCVTELEVFDLFSPFFLETYYYYYSAAGGSDLVGRGALTYSSIWRYAIDESFSFYSPLVSGLFADNPFYRAPTYTEADTTVLPTSNSNTGAIRLFVLEQTYLFLYNHGVCLHTLKKSAESVSVFTSAYLISTGFINVKSYLNAGVALMDMGQLDLGFMMASQSVVYEQQALYLRAGSPIESKNHAPHSGGLRIAFYCYEYGNAWWPGKSLFVIYMTHVCTTVLFNSTTFLIIISYVFKSEWGPSTVGKGGMGGSEEAVYYTSIELAKLGHEVFIFGDLGAIDVGYTTSYPSYCAEEGSSNSSISSGISDSSSSSSSSGRSVCATQGRVTWLHYSSFDMDELYDVFIAWRYVLSLSLSKSAKKSFVWLHDLISSSTFPSSFFALFDGIMVQSQFHKAYVEELFAEMAPSSNSLSFNASNSMVKKNVFIVPNGIADMHMMDGPNHANVFIYGSAPSRGLQYVLECWSYIKANIPEAVLRVFYGFTEAFQRSMRASLGEDQYRTWYGYMFQLLQQDGVEYYGTVNHKDLTDAYRHAGFFLYPTTFQETGCISVLRAMACGCIPITSKLRESVLFNLTHRFDMGPELSLTTTIARNTTTVRRWARELWAPSVVAAYRSDENGLREKRELMKKTIRNEYSWAGTANLMLQILNDY